ncbi:HNH endonuclease [Candidatus Pacearchaeota archaeon]|jgi:ribosomal protein L37E|nr:HNH endonuclease [Candidatus Pacearchaeota archaeon]
MYWNDNDLIVAVKESKTITQVLQKFGVPSNQGFYNRKFHSEIERLGIDTSHFRAPSAKNAVNLNKIMVENSEWLGRSSDLKKRLIRNNLLTNVCSKCGQKPFWNGQVLVLQIDHINGNNTDNRLENLRILCPNCHTQTETFSCRRRRVVNICKVCGDKHTTKSKLCRDCSLKTRPRKTKINWPSNDELIKLLKTTNYVELGRELGVSDNAIRKRLARNSTV